MLQAMTTDDAEQPVPLVRFQVMLVPIPVGPLPAEVQRAMRADAMREGWSTKNFFSREAFMRGAWVGLIPPIFMGVGFFLIGKSSALSSLGMFGSVLMVAVMFPIILLVMGIFSPLALTDHVRREWARTAVFAGYCGSCGYALPDVAEESTGLCRCPECGAAWARHPNRTKTKTLRPKGRRALSEGKRRRMRDRASGIGESVLAFMFLHVFAAFLSPLATTILSQVQLQQRLMACRNH